MAPFRHWTYLVLFTILIWLQKGEQTPFQKKLDLRKFGVSMGQLRILEEALALRLKKFKERLRFEQKRKLELEMEKKRNEIFQKHLLSRVSGTILNDFYSSRF